MIDNVSRKSEYFCSGCGACAVICPQKAVNLRENAKGFLEASVNHEVCVNCGHCISVCSKFNVFERLSLKNSVGYAMKSKNVYSVSKSSSGGFAHELSVAEIKRGMKVCGAKYNLTSDRVEHVIVDKEDDIICLDGSKYLQSNTQRAFAEIIRNVVSNTDDEYVVFGMPCQIVGLSAVAEKLNVRSNLLLVELFCHGVPSAKLWDKQCEIIKEKSGFDSFGSVEFRHKKNGWKSYCLAFTSGDKSFLCEKDGPDSVFWDGMFENILLNSSCQNCTLRGENSSADIRIGDFWGKRFSGSKEGVSAILAVTEKGKKAVELIDSSMIEPASADEILNGQYLGSYGNSELHSKAMEMLDCGTDVCNIISSYRKKLPLKAKIKRTVKKVLFAIKNR